MLFNSFPFFLFLIITLVVYFILNSKSHSLAGKYWLTFASFFFYGYWDTSYLPLIIGSILFNYFLGIYLAANAPKNFLSSKKLLYFGIITNVALLCYFKYASFIIENINFLLSLSIPNQTITLPLGISFFTFLQIAYLVDNYKHQAKDSHLVNYSLFVTFFPHLIAGPIVHHKDLMPQFDDPKTKKINSKHLAIGLSIFTIGLFKKIIIADTMSTFVTKGYLEPAGISLVAAWTTSLSYTFQLYFDFSGYSDMAIGAALLFNIKLPPNFLSPYKAVNIQDFWRRWHITLSSWLKEYIYIPLGGNQNGTAFTYLNLFLTFLIGGIWHGAGWNFFIWGALHGLAVATHRYWSKLKFKIPQSLSWLMTLFFVHCAWIFFRARNFSDAINIFRGMFGFNALGFAKELPRSTMTIAILFLCFLITRFTPNTTELESKIKFDFLWAVFIAFLLFISLTSLNKESEFLYFQF